MPSKSNVAFWDKESVTDLIFIVSYPIALPSAGAELSRGKGQGAGEGVVMETGGERVWGGLIQATAAAVAATARTVK